MFSFPGDLLPMLPKLEDVSISESLDLDIMKKVFNAAFKSSVSHLNTKVETKKEIEKSSSDKIIKKNLLNRPEKGLKVKLISGFELALMKPFNLSICKCKYFDIKVTLKALTDLQMPMTENLNLEIMVFSKNGVLITRNMSGNHILRGNFSHSLSFFVKEMAHVTNFRVQITEVSSHYEGKVVTLKVKAKKNQFLQSLGLKVKSLWIKDLIIKAKFPREESL